MSNDSAQSISYICRLVSRFEKPEFTDNCMLNLCYFGDKLYALTEGSMLREVDPATLDTVGGKVGFTFMLMSILIFSIFYF